MIGKIVIILVIVGVVWTFSHQNINVHVRDDNGYFVIDTETNKCVNYILDNPLSKSSDETTIEFKKLRKNLELSRGSFDKLSNSATEFREMLESNAKQNGTYDKEHFEYLEKNEQKLNNELSELDKINEESYKKIDEGMALTESNAQLRNKNK